MKKMNFYKILPIVLLFSNQLFAKECSLDYSIMYLVAMNEKHKDRNVGYPYLISFNNKKEASVAKHYINGFLDNRTIDCKNEKRCTDILKILFSAKITNLDLGAFQINYHYHKENLSDYFNLKKSYNIGCKIAEKHINNNAVTFQDIAKYHSLSRKYNSIYANSLSRNYKKLLSKNR